MGFFKQTQHAPEAKTRLVDLFKGDNGPHARDFPEADFIDPATEEPYRNLADVPIVQAGRAQSAGVRAAGVDEPMSRLRYIRGQKDALRDPRGSIATALIEGRPVDGPVVNAAALDSDEEAQLRILREGTPVAEEAERRRGNFERSVAVRLSRMELGPQRAFVAQIAEAVAALDNVHRTYVEWTGDLEKRGLSAPRGPAFVKGFGTHRERANPARTWFRDVLLRNLLPLDAPVLDLLPYGAELVESVRATLRNDPYYQAFHKD